MISRAFYWSLAASQDTLEPSLAFHTAASFTSNTNLQHYSGEVSLSYLSQLALMWLQFVSAATGIAALAALARGIGGQASMGNFFLDVQRASFLILLPLAIIVAAWLALSGVSMTLEGAGTLSRRDICGDECCVSAALRSGFLTL